MERNGYFYDKETGQWYQIVKLADGSINIGDVEVNIDPSTPLPVRITGSYLGYSYEDKNDIVPNPKRNDTFLELDTGRVFGYGTKWEEI